MRARSFGFADLVPSNAIINGAQLRLFARADGLGVDDFKVIATGFNVLTVLPGEGEQPHDIGYPLTRISDEIKLSYYYYCYY